MSFTLVEVRVLSSALLLANGPVFTRCVEGSRNMSTNLSTEARVPHSKRCKDCEFLGKFNGWDLYFCKPGKSPHPAIRAINHDDPQTELHAFEVSECSTKPVLVEALRLAGKEGLTLPTGPYVP